MGIRVEHLLLSGRALPFWDLCDAPFLWNDDPVNGSGVRVRPRGKTDRVLRACVGVAAVHLGIGTLLLLGLGFRFGPTYMSLEAGLFGPIPIEFPLLLTLAYAPRPSSQRR